MQLHTVKGIFTLRAALIQDLPALVRIHVVSWNATYPDYHPKPTLALREQQWKKAFEKNRDNWACFVAQHENGKLAGFVTSHDFKDKELPYKGQLDKIHILKEYQRLGLGRLLLGAVVTHFLDRGIDSMILFADPANPAIQFYEKLGAKRVPDKDGIFNGAFGWKDIRPLQDICKHDS